ncbi:MAG: DUF2892 domain-containing protein [Microgenomates group bacterium]
MTQNVGEMDRLIRAVVGVILILVGYSVGEGTWQIVLYILGGILVINALTGFCLVYKLLGMSTLKR